ncbi:MAG: hypothetical protein LBJ08_06275 [Bifidobacteriaceae bacterium]|jgi:hypothetical protein|nr:hypothetical protein [Bifidobacteriaceae bacterium]
MAQTATTTIRIPRSLHRQLSDYARSHGVTLAAALGRAIAAAHREEFWTAVEATMCSPEAVTSTHAEAAAMDMALTDGLDDESAYWREVLA